MRSEEFLHGGNSTDSFDCQPIFNLHDNSTWWVVGSNCNSQFTKVSTIYIQWRSPNPSLLERNERLGRKEGSDARAAGWRDLGALFLECSAGEKRCISILSLSSPFLICLNDVAAFITNPIRVVHRCWVTLKEKVAFVFLFHFITNLYSSEYLFKRYSTLTLINKITQKKILNVKVSGLPAQNIHLWIKCPNVHSEHTDQANTTIVFENLIVFIASNRI